MNYMIIFVGFLVAGVAIAGLQSEYITEHGGVSNQEVLVHSEMKYSLPVKQTKQMR